MEFCFAGIAQRSLIAISTLGLKAASFSLFEQGYRVMLERLHPSQVICYGTLPARLDGLADVKCYDTRWQALRGAHGR